MKNLSYKLKLERARAGMTVEELAEKSRVGRGTIYRVESGMAMPRISTIGRMAMALGIEVEQLIEDNELYFKDSNEVR